MSGDIPAELKLLGAAVFIGLIQTGWAAFAANRQRGFGWAAGPRDEPRAASGVPARLQRAQANFLETFPLYAAAILGAILAEKLGTLTLWGSVLYVVGRAIYVPAYAFGWGVRSIVWFVSLFGLLMVAAALLA